MKRKGVAAANVIDVWILGVLGMRFLCGNLYLSPYCAAGTSPRWAVPLSNAGRVLQHNRKAAHQPQELDATYTNSNLAGKGKEKDTLKAEKLFVFVYRPCAQPVPLPKLLACG